MINIKQRIIEIVNSLPNNYFNNLKPTEIVFKLMIEYINKYGEDETTIIPGTNKYLNYETIKKILEN